MEVKITKTILFTGVIDEYPEDDKGRRWVEDHKTHKNLPDEETRFSDYQLLTYVKLLILLGEKPAGVLWDYLRTKPPAVPEQLKAGGLSQRANIDTTWEVYRAAILAHGLDESSYGKMKELLADKEESFFRRIFLPYSKVMVQQVFDETLSAAQQIERFGTEWVDRSMTKECKTCQFYTLCHAELRGLDADFIRKVDFEIKKDEYDGRKETDD